MYDPRMLPTSIRLVAHLRTVMYLTAACLYFLPLLLLSSVHSRPSTPPFPKASAENTERALPSAHSQSQIKLYVDGSLQGATDFGGGWRAAGHAEIGRGMFAGKPTDFVNGNILDARIYSRALNEREIEHLYTAGPDPGWQIDRTGRRLTATDLRNQGAFVGGAQWLSGSSEGVLNLSRNGAYVDLHKGVVDASKSYTVSAWVRLRRLGGSQTFVSQDGVNLSSFYLQLRGDDNRFALSVRREDAMASTWVTAESTFVPLINVFYHVVGVYDKTEMPALPWDVTTQGGFVLSLCRDLQGRIWAGTEGQGVWRFDPNSTSSKPWTQFTAKDGLGDDSIYALICDRKGRIWAGTLRHGVSIFNGKGWKSYGPLEGSLGSRVFALATSPTDGDVWGATEAGLFRYSLLKNIWSYYTRSEGLPANATTALAFNPQGGLFVATEADGIAYAFAHDAYQHWHTVQGPRHLPRGAGGSGLPTNLINCLLVTRSGSVYCGTDVGLARSQDDGKTWRFIRGVDWSDKTEGLSPKKWLDEGLEDNADVRAIEVEPLPNLSDPGGKGTATEKPVRIAAGGGGTGEWRDRFFQGGNVFHTATPVDTSAVPSPAPQAVYQDARWGSFTYIVPSLHPHAFYRVRLHLAETAWDHPGQRVFNVTINGIRQLDHLDIYATAGLKNKAILKEFTVQADASGRIAMAFRGAQPLPSFDHHNPYELTEDYVSALAEDGAGNLLVGHRQSGLEVIDPADGRRLFPKAQDRELTDFVTALLPQEDGSTLVSCYGDGLLTKSASGGPFRGLKAVSATRDASHYVNLSPDAVPSLPSSAKPPSLKELNDLLSVATSIGPDPRELEPNVIALNDDWLTEGDWLGRYGRYWASLPAFCSPYDYFWGAGWETISYNAQVGANRGIGDSLRYWVQTPYTTDPRNLELPPTYLDSRIKKGLTTRDVNRRDASQDDHGEAYPMILGGPHIYTNLNVPMGLFYLSIYEFNRQEGACRDRDFRISVRARPKVSAIDDISSFESEPELVHGRVHQYHGGVYKRFLVRGPVALTIQLDRNNSWNTELDGVMLDLVDETPAPYFETVAEWNMRQADLEKKRLQSILAWSPAVASGRHIPFCLSEAEAANQLFDRLETMRTTSSTWWINNTRSYYLALCRWYAAAAKESAFVAPPRLYARLGTCYYQLGLYTQWEQCQRQIGLTPARDVEKALRWDGVTDTGAGYQVVTDYLAAKNGRKVGQARR